MATWWTQSEISEIYRVGEARLLSFVARGNLPMSRDAFGERVFDVEVVERLFRRRDGQNERGGAVLGGFKLGERLPEREPESDFAPRSSRVRMRPVRLKPAHDLPAPVRKLRLA